MAILNKATILQGKKIIETVHIKALENTEYNPDVDIRNINDGEYNQILAIRQDMGTFNAKVDMEEAQKNSVTDAIQKKQKNITKDLNIDIDPKKSAESKYKADCLAAAYGLSHSGQVWQISDVARLPIGSAEQISKEVIRISGLDNPKQLNDDVESFREGE